MENFEKPTRIAYWFGWNSRPFCLMPHGFRKSIFSELKFWKTICNLPTLIFRPSIRAQILNHRCSIRQSRNIRFVIIISNWLQFMVDFLLFSRYQKDFQPHKNGISYWSETVDCNRHRKWKMWNPYVHSSVNECANRRSFDVRCK